MIKNAAVFIINIYQLIFSPDRGLFRRPLAVCRFYPSCSEYTKQAIMKYGLAIGLFRGLKRIGRCHPFHKGGYDPLV